MNWITVYALLLLNVFILPENNLPAYLLGDFADDYEINYTISESSWVQYPDLEFDIVKIDTTQMFLLGYDQADSTYTRIDYMRFHNQGDYKWGFCYTTYDKGNAEDAMTAATANRATPRTGCNGFPFSRMKPTSLD